MVMEPCKTNKYVSNKRTRASISSGSEPDSSKSKRVQTDINTCLNSLNSEESGKNDEIIDLASPEAKQIRENIMHILEDEPETILTDQEPKIDELDTVIKSFEEEIVNPQNVPRQESFIDLTLLSDSGELCHLLEASDDELGLPPSENNSNTIGFENKMMRFDSYDLGTVAGIMDGDNYGGGGGGDGDFVTVGRLFDYQEPSEISWQAETLPAL